MKVKDLDIIYISYDEPNAEENFRDLKTKCSKAKRIHNIKGFDKAHKEAAKLAESEYFFIIDGDNKVSRDFFDLEIDLPGEGQVLSWASKNIINGLIYGNGGIKLWSKKIWSNIDCHDSGKAVDWCYSVSYLEMNDWYSYSFCNASPFQAFRTGFREGVKLCLDSSGSRKPNLMDNIESINANNLRRLITWMTIGEDVVNGVYAIYGARLAFLRTICEESFNINQISDYKWFDDYWNTELSFVRDGHYGEHYDQMAKDIKRITALPVTNIHGEASLLLKSLVPSPARLGPMEKSIPDNQLFMKNNFKEKYLE